MQLFKKNFTILENYIWILENKTKTDFYDNIKKL